MEREESTSGLIWIDGKQSVKSDRHFYGRSFQFKQSSNWQTIKVVYKEETLINTIFPSFERAFKALGFAEVEWWGLLKLVAIGGEVVMTGPR